MSPTSVLTRRSVKPSALPAAQLFQPVRTRPDRCRVKYGVGDVIIWDSAPLLRSATLSAPDDARSLRRITIKEERIPS
jgi:alpha-ketoglutarate-dependent taurine dioxygenase